MARFCVTAHSPDVTIVLAPSEQAYVPLSVSTIARRTSALSNGHRRIKVGLKSTHILVSAPEGKRAMAACDSPSQIRVPAVPKFVPAIWIVALPVTEVGQVQVVPEQPEDGKTKLEIWPVQLVTEPVATVHGVSGRWRSRDSEARATVRATQARDRAPSMARDSQMISELIATAA